MVNVAIVTMAYNEAFNLPHWIKYYSSIFGQKNLFVIDHGSTDESTREIGNCGYIYLPRENLDNKKRTGFVNLLTKGLFNYYDVVIYTDCDEFLIPDLTKYTNLRHWIELNPQITKAAIGLNIFHNYNSEPDLDLTKPILRQREFAYFRSSLSKPLILFKPAEWSLGFHNVGCEHEFADDLYLLHTRFLDKRLSLGRLDLTRSMQWSADEYKLNPYHYQRLADEEFLKSFADGRINYIPSGVEKFEFADYVDRLRRSRTFDGKVTHFDLNLAGRPTRMPAWMRDLF